MPRRWPAWFSAASDLRCLCASPNPTMPWWCPASRQPGRARAAAAYPGVPCEQDTLVPITTDHARIVIQAATAESRSRCVIRVPIRSGNQRSRAFFRDPGGTPHIQVPHQARPRNHRPRVMRENSCCADHRGVIGHNNWKARRTRRRYHQQETTTGVVRHQ